MPSIQLLVLKDEKQVNCTKNKLKKIIKYQIRLGIYVKLSTKNIYILRNIPSIKGDKTNIKYNKIYFGFRINIGFLVNKTLDGSLNF
jgi:hypothetical protein